MGMPSYQLRAISTCRRSGRWTIHSDVLLPYLGVLDVETSTGEIVTGMPRPQGAVVAVERAPRLYGDMRVELLVRQRPGGGGVGRRSSYV